MNIVHFINNNVKFGSDSLGLGQIQFGLCVLDQIVTDQLGDFSNMKHKCILKVLVHLLE